jgi:hypothetical protein
MTTQQITTSSSSQPERKTKWERFSSLDSKNFDEFEEKIALYIEMKIEKMKLHLLKLGKEINEQEINDNVIKDLQMNRGLDFGDLCSCEVRDSPVHGRGLFATYPIANGDVITLYPADIPASYEDDNIRYKLPPEGHPFFTSADDLQDYTIELKDFVLVGDPLSIQEGDSTYLGHMINDGMKCTSSAGEKSYNLLSPMIANAGFCLISESFICVVATRDITANEEIFVSYGETYWQRKYPST